MHPTYFTMKNTLPLLLLCFNVALHAAKPPQANPPRNPEDVPAGLAKSDWQSIREAYEAGRHCFQPMEGGWQARNPGQQWTTQFDGRGFLAKPTGGDWTWGLELKSYGVGPKQTPMGASAPQVKADGQRLTYDWDATIQEWWVNDQRGLEHGYIVRERPYKDAAAGEKLSLLLLTRGNLSPKVADDAQGVHFADASGATVLNYAGLKVWDAEGKVLPSRFESGGEKEVRLIVDDAEALYPLTIDPIAQQAYLKASNTGAGDGFGLSVAISGDTVVVGATSEASKATGVNGDGTDNSAVGAGAAYVFTRSGSQWSQQAYLKAFNTETVDQFGTSVAVSGDTVVVGAVWESSNATGIDGDGTDNSAFRAGAAYVFTRSGSQWSQQAYLKASNTGAGDEFGNSVAISGDTVVVGARGEASNATGVNGNETDNSAGVAGAAYVFTRSGSQWSQLAYLKASNTGAGDEFGNSVAISGDTVVVGARGEASNATGVNGNETDNSAGVAGAAYVFTRSGSQWSQQAYLKASNTETVDLFGYSVAILGDTVVVGAPGEASNATGVNGNGADNTAPQAGAAYVFTRSGSQWIQQSYLKASNAEAYDLFGYSVAILGDTVVIGAPGEASNATGINGNGTDNSLGLAGAAYVFMRGGSQWSQQAYLKAFNAETVDRFGYSVAISGDTVVVGAPGEASNAKGVNGNGADNTAPQAGAAYLFTGIGPVLASLAKSGVSAPGGLDLSFSKVYGAAVNDSGGTLSDYGLTGAGAARGRNRGIFSTLGLGGGVALVQQRWDDLGGLVWAGYLPGNHVIAFKGIVANQSTSGGLIQATVAGGGLNSFNNTAIFQDNGAYLGLLFRTGKPVAALGGAEPYTISETLQSLDPSAHITLPHQLRLSTFTGVNRSNDSGILALTSAGSVLPATPMMREGSPAFGGGGNFGQFTAVRSGGRSGSIDFGAAFLSSIGGGAQQALFSIRANGSNSTRYAKQGDLEPSVAPAAFRSFLAVTSSLTSSLYRATLSGSPSATNEGVWSSGSGLILRKGTVFDPLNFPGVVVRRIIRFWGRPGGQVIFQATLGGTGVNRANNQALLLRQADGKFLALLRTGSQPPGVGRSGVTVAALQSVDVDPINGHYVIVGSLRGAPRTANQALWTGQTTLGGDTGPTQQLRLPGLRLLKGNTYSSNNTPRDMIRGIVLKPVLERTGAGGRGLAQAIGANGHVVVFVTGDRRAQELVRLDP